MMLETDLSKYTLICDRCKIEHPRNNENGMKFSNIISGWLCKICFELSREKYSIFIHEFTNPSLQEIEEDKLEMKGKLDKEGIIKMENGELFDVNLLKNYLFKGFYFNYSGKFEEYPIDVTLKKFRNKDGKM